MSIENLAPDPDPTSATEPAPPPEPEDSPEPEGSPAPKKPNLDRAFMKLDRQKQARAEEKARIEEDRKKLETERAQHRERLERADRLEEALARLAEGDDSLAAELLGKNDLFDRLTDRRLHPERAQTQELLRRELSLRDKRIADLEAIIRGQQEEQTRAHVAQVQSSLVGYARSLKLPELEALEDHEIIEHADRYAAGRDDATFQEIVDALVARQRPRLERIRGLLGVQPPVSAPATPAPRKRTPPTTTAADAATPGGAPPAEETLEELEARLARELAAARARRRA